MNKIISKAAVSLTAAFFVLVILPDYARSGISGEITETISLGTVQCGMCERTIGKALDKLEGIKDYEIDIDGKKLTVTFNDGITDLSKIENAISKAGYDANETKADKKAYDKLNNCCKLPKDR